MNETQQIQKNIENANRRDNARLAKAQREQVARLAKALVDRINSDPQGRGRCKELTALEAALNSNH